MYPNNNLHQKLAINDILNNVSLSLSLFWGPYSYIMCTFFFFFWDWMHYVYQGVKEEKLPIQNRNFFKKKYSSTLSHRSQNNLFHSIV